MKVSIPQSIWDQIKGLLREDGVESAAIGLATVAHSDSSTRLILRELRFAADSDYSQRSLVGAELTPRFVAEAVADARRDGLRCVFLHTHPHALNASFSSTDDRGERVLHGFLSRRTPHVQHLAMVVTPHHSCARVLGTDTAADISIVGRTVFHELPSTPSSTPEQPATDLTVFDRQIRALGREAQLCLARLRVAIVGLGGTGSVAAQQLAHLGVRNFVFIDPDVLERTNLNRVAGACEHLVGTPKVDVAVQHVASISSDIRCEVLRQDVMANTALAHLTNVDAVFCCTDSHGSRYVLNELAYRYLIPCVDIGVAIIVKQGVDRISGRVQLLSPGLPCLMCQGTLDPAAVRCDLMSELERANDPYVVGAVVPEPAVMSINSTVVSLGVTMFLATFAGLPSSARYLRYDGIGSTVRAATSTAHSGCVTCSRRGSFASGDSLPLPGRPNV